MAKCARFVNKVKNFRVLTMKLKSIKQINMKLSCKYLLITAFLFFVTGSLFSQSNQPYNPTLDGHKQIENAVAQAKQEGKHVFLMIGGNW